jgi:hypothetical protein
MILSGGAYFYPLIVLNYVGKSHNFGFYQSRRSTPRRSPYFFSGW